MANNNSPTSKATTTVDSTKHQNTSQVTSNPNTSAVTHPILETANVKHSTEPNDANSNEDPLDCYDDISNETESNDEDSFLSMDAESMEDVDENEVNDLKQDRVKHGDDDDGPGFISAETEIRLEKRREKKAKARAQKNIPAEYPTAVVKVEESPSKSKEPIISESESTNKIVKSPSHSTTIVPNITEVSSSTNVAPSSDHITKPSTAVIDDDVFPPTTTITNDSCSSANIKPDSNEVIVVQAPPTKESSTNQPSDSDNNKPSNKVIDVDAPATTETPNPSENAQLTTSAVSTTSTHSVNTYKVVNDRSRNRRISNAKSSRSKTPDKTNCTPPQHTYNTRVTFKMNIKPTVDPVATIKSLIKELLREMNQLDSSLVILPWNQNSSSPSLHSNSLV